jgi:hypothetical protein
MVILLNTFDFWKERFKLPTLELASPKDNTIKSNLVLKKPLIP